MLLDKVCFCCFSIDQNITCEQALLDSLAVGWEKEGELATTSLEFEYPYWETLIGGDDISNEIVTLACVFLMFDIYICACFCFMLIDGTLTAQSTESHLGIGGGIQTMWGRKGVKTWENRKQERSGGERGKSGRWEFLKVESGRNRENLFNKA